MVYISRIRPHDADTKRRIYARERAQKLDSLRGQFIDWARIHGKSEQEIKEGVDQLDELAQNWRASADQGGVD